MPSHSSAGNNSNSWWHNNGGRMTRVYRRPRFCLLRSPLTRGSQNSHSDLPGPLFEPADDHYFMFHFGTAHRRPVVNPTQSLTYPERGGYPFLTWNRSRSTASFGELLGALCPHEMTRTFGNVRSPFPRSSFESGQGRNTVCKRCTVEWMFLHFCFKHPQQRVGHLHRLRRRTLLVRRTSSGVLRTALSEGLSVKGAALT